MAIRSATKPTASATPSRYCSRSASGNCSNVRWRLSHTAAKILAPRVTLSNVRTSLNDERSTNIVAAEIVSWQGLAYRRRTRKRKPRMRKIFVERSYVAVILTEDRPFVPCASQLVL